MKITTKLAIIFILVVTFVYIVQHQAKAQASLQGAVLIEGVWVISKRIGKVYSDQMEKDRKSPRNTKPCENCAHNNDGNDPKKPDVKVTD